MKQPVSEVAAFIFELCLDALTGFNLAGDLIWVRLASGRVSQTPSALITATANGLHNFSFCQSLLDLY